MLHLIDGFLSQLIRVTANKSAPDNKLSGADHHLSFTLAFGVLATGIGTVEPTATCGGHLTHPTQIFPSRSPLVVMM
jgi:homoaconitase/3-isopropylmalate dehydratase large subunit